MDTNLMAETSFDGNGGDFGVGVLVGVGIVPIKAADGKMQDLKNMKIGGNVS